MGFASTLALPYPRLIEGRFASVTALTDEALFDACGVRVAFTERTGGVSLPPYDSLNLGDHVSDEASSVAANRRILLDAFAAGDAVLVNPLQVHGDRIIAVCDDGELPVAVSAAREGADAVAVMVDDVAALLCFADCMPVIIVAPTGAFAVVHAGWRGVENRIASQSVALLADRTGCDPSSFNVYMGPHIRSCCFEVGEQVCDRFASGFGDSVCLSADGSPHVDLAAAMRIQLSQVGIDADRIADSGICTVCDTERFFSYRAADGVCGRHGAFAVRFGDRSHASSCRLDAGCADGMEGE